jgi:hypothetical protein
MDLVIKYTKEDLPVPDGWVFRLLEGHHGANGYGFIMKNREKDDFYPTPDYATHTLMKHWGSEVFSSDIHCYSKDVWEPACGDGAISKLLKKDYGLRVASTDLVNRGFGKSGVDFLMETKTPAPWIITNPPYKLANQFVIKCLNLFEEDREFSGFAMLLRLAFLEGQGRHKAIFEKKPPSDVLVFSKRLTMIRGDHDEAWYGSGKMAFAWFIWCRNSNDDTRLKWIND